MNEFFAILIGFLVVPIELGLSLIKYMISHWILFAIIFFLLWAINSIVKRLSRLESAFMELSQRKQIDVNCNNKVDDLENNSMSEKIEKEVAKILDDRLNFSLVNIYDEKSILGHEWTYKINSEHWVTAVYNERNGKFTVKHFRTNKDTSKNTQSERISEDMEHNSKNIYGNSSDSGDGMTKINGIFVPKNKI